LRAELQESPSEAMSASRWAHGLERSHLSHVFDEVTEYEVAAGHHVCRKGEPVTGWLGVIAGLDGARRIDEDRVCTDVSPPLHIDHFFN